MRKYVLAFIVWFIYRTLALTWRVHIFEPDEMKRALGEGRVLLLAHWHGDELALIQLASRYRLATITSTSKDGELVNSVLWLLGARTSRGSSTRGGANALKGLLRLAKGGRNCSFAVDGPKGPLHKVKPGIFEASRILRAPIYASGVCCSRAWHFPKSWNKTYLPKPFAKIYIHWTGPLGPVTHDDDPRGPILADKLAAQINLAQSAAKQRSLKVIAQHDA